MNNSNALAEIQSKYPNCNLLLPAATSVQINPFYKCSVMEVVADTAPSSGDIFSVGKVKTGEDGKGKAIYEDVFSPAKPLLMKLATAAGIQFHPEYTTVIRENTNTYVGKAYGAVRLPDGSYKTHMETKRICLDDEESKYRLEFMDKSIMGIHDWRAAKAASEMFKGEWKDDPEKMNQWGKPEERVEVLGTLLGLGVYRNQRRATPSWSGFRVAGGNGNPSGNFLLSTERNCG